MPFTAYILNKERTNQLCNDREALTYVQLSTQYSDTHIPLFVHITLISLASLCNGRVNNSNGRGLIISHVNREQ